MEDALQQSIRSAVQSFDYAHLARNGQRIDQQRALQTARKTFVQNLSTVSGLVERPEALAERVTWRVLPEGGTCSFSDGLAQTFDRPAMCAEVRPVMTGFGLLGYAPYRPLITAAVHLQETFSDVVKTDKTGLSKTAHTRWMISAFANFLPGSTIFRLA